MELNESKHLQSHALQNRHMKTKVESVNFFIAAKLVAFTPKELVISLIQIHPFAGFKETLFMFNWISMWTSIRMIFMKLASPLRR